MNKISSLFMAVAFAFIAPTHANESAKKFTKFEVLKRQVLNMGLGCKIAFSLDKTLKMQAGNGGNPRYHVGGLTITPLPRVWHSRKDKLHLTFSCNEKNHINNPQPSGVYDEKTDSWRKDREELRKYLAKSQDYSDPEFLEEKLSTIHVYDVKTPNAHGWADTSDDTTGDEDARVRYMSFCIYHESRALCGLSQVAYLSDGPDGDLTPQVLKILRTIQFLD